MSNVVIVGGGIAGQTAVEQIRSLDPEIPITLICGEPRLPYDRVRLSEILVDGDGPEALALRPPEWYEDNAVEVLIGARVQSANTQTRTVALSDGSERGYSALVLATGSQPLMPPLPGIDLAGVHPFRGPEDCEAIRQAAAVAGTRAVVIGGGLLGLEAARGIVAQGAPVTVVHLLDRLMERQLDATAAGMLLPKLAVLGVGVELERQTTALLPTADGSVRGLAFADGDHLDADLVVVSIGIRPEVTLAKEIGLAVERGIVVDDQLTTSAPGIYALGECAQHRGVVHGLVAPIHDQARVLARTIVSDEAGERVAYEGSVSSAKLKVAGIDLVSIGAAEGAAQAISADGEAGTYRKLVVEDGVVVGAVLLGDIRGHEALLSEIQQRTAVEDPLARLVDAAAIGPADLPDSAQICNCNGICKGQLVAAVLEDGCTSPREVMARTRAGTGCGSCKPSVIEIVQAAGGNSSEPAYLCACAKQTREQLAAQIREHELEAVSEVSELCGTGRECGACKPALAYLVSEINHNRHREERHARFINDRVHANIQNDGTFSVVPRMYGGVVTPEQLRRIADAAEKYNVRMVKVTGGQRIDLLGVDKADLPDIWRDLDMPSGHAYAKAVRTVKTCVGKEFCRFGIGESVSLGIEMEQAWEGLHTPAKVKSGVSGCPRNCAEATVKDIGVVAVEGGWQIRVGGAAGGTVREADLLVTVATRAEALRVCTVFLQFYRENADYKERTYDFVPRIGLDELRRIVTDPGTSLPLLERFRIARAAVADPWLERDNPYHPRQFNDLDDVELVGPPAGGGR